MALFHWIEFANYTGDDAMLEDFDPEDWHTLEAVNLDEAVEKVKGEIQALHPNIVRWEQFSKQTGGSNWAHVWLEAPHADHYLSLKYREQNEIGLFAIVDHEAFRTHIL